MAYIEMKNSYKRYQVGDTEIIANNDEFWKLKRELVIILGASGAGKSTVLNILGGMDTNDDGHVFVDGVDISALMKNNSLTIEEMMSVSSSNFII